MPKYRKRPIEIEAWHNTREPPQPVPEWLKDAIGTGTVRYNIDRWGPWLTIQTREGLMRADYGDWIIRGIEGELYPCKPDIFAATYEPV